MPGTWKFRHGGRREYGGKLPRDLAGPWRAGRAEQQQQGLPDLAGGAGHVGGGEGASFARQRRSNDGEHIPPAWCIAQRLHLAARQADDLGEEGESRTASLAVGHHGGDSLGPLLLRCLWSRRLVERDAPERGTERSCTKHAGGADVVTDDIHWAALFAGLPVPVQASLARSCRLPGGPP